MSMTNSAFGAPTGDAGASPSGQQATQGFESNGQGQPQGQPQGQGQGQPQVSDLASGFLGRVDPAHRAIVEPYVKQWDAGVTRRFQDLHSQLRPYEEIGADPVQLQAAYRLYQMVDQDPQQVLQILQEAVGADGGAGVQQQGPLPQGQPQLGQGQAPGQLPQQQPGQAPGALPPEVQQQFDMMQQMLEALGNKVLEGDQQSAQAQEDSELDDYIGLLKQEFGEFDERYVLSQMMAGMDGEQAVQAFQQLVQGQVNQRSAPPVPPILGGGGAIPQEQQSIAKAGRGDVKNLVANILAQANSQ